MAPETMDQAKRFGKRLAKYLSAGLCHTCAAQAAYGHVDGWHEVNPPCSTCATIVARLPLGTPSSAWRKLPFSGADEGSRGTETGDRSGAPQIATGSLIAPILAGICR